MKSSNQAALANLLQQRTAQTVKRGTSNPALEFGTMDGALNLVVDGLPSPLTQYMVCRQLSYGPSDKVVTKTKIDGAHLHAELTGTDGEHEHEVLVGEKMRSLQPGDRVLVAWVACTPVVIDIILDRSDTDG